VVGGADAFLEAAVVDLSQGAGHAAVGGGVEKQVVGADVAVEAIKVGVL
jgi:hypothetical protein